MCQTYKLSFEIIQEKHDFAVSLNSKDSSFYF